MQASRDVTRLVAIMAALRDPRTGCAWDVAQTHRSLASYAIEEAYEVVDAIERGDPDDLRDELGDLLLQVVFHARLAEEAGAFDFGGVVEAVTAKMVRRHPHVFAERDPLSNAPRSPDAWEAIKAGERRARKAVGAPADGLLAGVPLALPALTRAAKLQAKAARVGFDWADAGLILAKIREEVDEVAGEVERGGDALAGEIGDAIFALVNLARHVDIDPETAVRATNGKFERRFAFIEEQLALRGSSVEAAGLDEMDALWDLAKARGL